MFCKISVLIKDLSNSRYALFAALLWLSLIPASFSSAEAQPILKGSRINGNFYGKNACG